MKVWILQPSEILPITKDKKRLMRMGLLSSELVKKNHEVIWFTSTFDHFTKKQYFENDTKIKVQDNYYLELMHAMGYKKNISIQRILNHKIIGMKLKKYMKKEDKPDIIFVSFPTIEFALEAVKYGKKNNVPVVVDVRDLWPDIFKQNLSGLLRFLAIPYIWFLDRKTKKILSGCYKVTSISNLMLDWGLKKGKRIKTCLDKSFYIGYKKEENIIEKEVIKDKNNEFNICFFATINNQFDYELISQIGKSLIKDNVNIIICGDGPNFPYLKEKCQNLNNIKLLGWCDIDKLNEVLLKSCIGLAPYKDTFDFRMSVSNKFCEYLSHGFPVIITSGGYMKEIIDKYKVGISSRNTVEIRKFILKLKNNSNIYKKMSNNAISLFNNYFDAKKIYPDMVNYLEEVREEYNK